MLIDSNPFVSSMDCIMSVRYPPYTVRRDMARHRQVDLSFFDRRRNAKCTPHSCSHRFPPALARHQRGGVHGFLPALLWLLLWYSQSDLVYSKPKHIFLVTVGSWALSCILIFLRIRYILALCYLRYRNPIPHIQHTLSCFREVEPNSHSFDKYI